MKYILHTDGGSRGNPGKAGIGIVISDDNNNIIETYSEFIGMQTNNYAEYSALIKGLNISIDKNIKEMDCYLDSELVVKQLKGIYRVKDETLKTLHAKAISLTKNFDKIEFIHVKRNLNKEADKLVNKALDEESKN